jgi:sulfane dehydrogenase subunit SoxC
MTTHKSRRRFLKTSAGVGLLAGAVPAARSHETDPLSRSAYGERSSYDTAVRVSDLGSNCSFASDCNTLTPLQDLHGIITPPPLHFNSAHGAFPPDINPDEFTLYIHGLVDRPLKFSLAELKRLPFISRIMHIECEANYPHAHQDTTPQHTHGKVSCSEWTGVPISVIMQECGVQPAGKWTVCEGMDRDLHSKSIPMASLMEGILAYAQNGAPLMPHQGFPLRIVIPGAGGFSNVKWIHRIKVTEEPYLTPSERFSQKFSVKSVITFPSGGQQLQGSGYYTISGMAWSGRGAIKQVDISADGGTTWQRAKLESPVLPTAITRFSLEWNWDGSETVLMSRALDDAGNVQPTPEEVAQKLNASVDQVKRNRVRSPDTQWNMIFPWRIKTDGSVHNDLWT